MSSERDDIDEPNGEVMDKKSDLDKKDDCGEHHGRGRQAGMAMKQRIVAMAMLILSASWLFGQSASGNAANTNAVAPASTSAIDANNLAGKAHDNTFVIGNDDVLAINVWKEPDISRSIPVRSDGKISLPLVGELQAAGQTPQQLELQIAAKLKSFISEPEVTVIVQQINSQKFNVLGQVTHPGAYPLTNSMTVLDALALAGGFRDFAKQKSIYVLRQNPDGGQTRLNFNYKDVIKGKDTAQNVRLQPRDTIVVP